MAQLKFEMNKGEQFTLEATIYDEDNVVTPITGATCVLTVVNRLSNEIVITETGTNTDEPNGVTEFSISASDTGVIGHYLYRIETTYPNGDILKTAVADWFIKDNF